MKNILLFLLTITLSYSSLAQTGYLRGRGMIIQNYDTQINDSTTYPNAIGADADGLFFNSDGYRYTMAELLAQSEGGGGITEVTGTSNRIDVTNGTTDPIIDISSSYVGQSSITTLGTIGTGIWNGTTIGGGYGGTGRTSNPADEILIGSGTNVTSSTNLKFVSDILTVTNTGNTKLVLDGASAGLMLKHSTTGEPLIAYSNGLRFGSATDGTLSDFTVHARFTTGGNFGIGTVPSAKLHINGAPRFDLGSDATGDLRVRSATGIDQRIAAVATGNALISQGVGAVPIWGKISLSSAVSGNLSVSNLNSGTGASASTFWRGDGAWANSVSGGFTATDFTATNGSNFDLKINGASDSIYVGLADNFTVGKLIFGTTGTGDNTHVYLKTADAPNDIAATYAGNIYIEAGNHGRSTQTAGSVYVTAGVNTSDASSSGAVYIQAGGSNKLVTTSDGRIYGTSLHNNAGSLTGTTNQYIASGTYTPTFTGVSNVSSTTNQGFRWTRLGNVVEVKGIVSITPTATSTNTVLRISLPIASTFSATGDASGDGTSVLNNGNADGFMARGAAFADITNHEIGYRFYPTTLSVHYHMINFSYEIK